MLATTARVDRFARCGANSGLDTWDMGKSKWDLIAAIYGPSRQWADRIVDALKAAS